MTIIVEFRDHFTLDAYRRAAWQGEAVRIADADGQSRAKGTYLFFSFP